MPDESQCKVIYPFIVVGRQWNLEKQTRSQTGCPRDTKRRKTESSEAKRITKKETGWNRVNVRKREINYSTEIGF